MTTHPKEAVEAVARALHRFGVEVLTDYGIDPDVPRNDIDFSDACTAEATALLDQIAPLYREQAARDAWRDMPPPNDEDILVLRSTGALQYIESDDNDYTWHDAAYYADTGDGIDCPVAWTPAAAIRKGE